MTLPSDFPESSCEPWGTELPCLLLTEESVPLMYDFKAPAGKDFLEGVFEDKVGIHSSWILSIKEANSLSVAARFLGNLNLLTPPFPFMSSITPEQRATLLRRESSGTISFPVVHPDVSSSAMSPKKSSTVAP